MTIMNGSESKFKRFLNTEHYFYLYRTLSVLILFFFFQNHYVLILETEKTYHVLAKNK